ncbi:MAG: Crp/Fnr family transcriptional regulator [Clostridium sp.]
MYEEYFNHIPQEKMRNFFLEVLAPIGDVKHYKKNEHIDYFPGAKLSIVTEGKIKVCIYTKKGLEKILFFLIPGEIYGEESLFYSHVDITPITLEDTSISFIDNETLENYLKDNPKYYEYFLQSILRKYQISLFQMGDILKRSPKAQICSALCRMAIQTMNESLDSNTPIELSIPLTHEALGNLIGCSRVTVTRVINELKAQGILASNNKKIIILDFDSLKKYCD